MRNRWLGLLALWLMISSVSAQQDWTVVKQCIQPTRASENWSFEGTILLRGYGGVHGVNALWDTPHIVAQIPPVRPYGVALSPDEFWYAVLDLDRFCATKLNSLSRRSHFLDLSCFIAKHMSNIAGTDA